jgi:hypothetical protein
MSGALFLGSSQDMRQFSLPELLVTLSFIGEENPISDWKAMARSKMEHDHNTVAGYSSAIFKYKSPRDG